MPPIILLELGNCSAVPIKIGILSFFQCMYYSKCIIYCALKNRIRRKRENLAKIGLAEEVPLTSNKNNNKALEIHQHKENKEVYLWCP